MSRKKRYLCIFITLIGLSWVQLWIVPQNATAEDIRVNEYASIAPTSIPVVEISTPPPPLAGTDNVGITKFRWQARTNGTTSAITSMEIQLNYEGSFDRSKIEAVNVYFEPQGGNGTFDRGGGDDVDAIDSSVLRPVTFATDTLTILIDKATAVHDTNGWAILWIAFDFASDADITDRVSCQINSVDWEDLSAVPTTGQYTPPNHAQIVFKPVDDYEVTLNGTSSAPTGATQGDTKISMLRLDFDLTDTTIDNSVFIYNVYLDSVRVRKTGTPGADADIDSGGVILYEDTDGSGDLSDNDNPLAAATMGASQAGYAIMDIPIDFPFHHTGISPHKTFFIAINISVTAGVGNSVGLEIEDPSSDIVFADLADDINPISANYATVSTPYVQEGYILSQTAISSGTLTISELVLDVQPPSEPIATNNRILPGSTDPVKIYIPEPAGGPNTKVTVQIYTTTGKRVATLLDNRPYSQIESQLPLFWYGKNGRQQNLGPGLYFIQVVSGSDKKVLKVLIVR
jgi:hypothetical protein